MRNPLSDGASSFELQQRNDTEASTDDEGEIPPVSSFGVLLGRTSPGCRCCPICAVCPTGSLTVLLVSLLISLGTAGWGVHDTQRLSNDVSPNVDGFAPRRSDVGDRGNTYNLLFKPQGFNALTSVPGICSKEGVCLAHHPPKLFGRHLLTATESTSTSPRRAARRQTARRQLQRGASDSALCPADLGSNALTFPVLFGSRELAVNDGCDGRDCSAAAQLTVLTGNKLAAMCEWEDALFDMPEMQQSCQGPGGGRASDAQGDTFLATCCRPVSVPRVIASLVGKRCAHLSDSDVRAAMGILLACRARGTGSNCTELSAQATEEVSVWADQLCGDAMGHRGLLPNGVCPPKPDSSPGKPISPDAAASEWSLSRKTVPWVRTAVSSA